MTLPNTRSRPAHGFAVAVAIPTLLFVAHMWQFRAWLVDDAMISMAYARTLTEGGGLAQQVGAEPVEGFSNPAWTLLWAALRLLGLVDRGHEIADVPDYVIAVKTMSVLLFVAVLVLFERMNRAIVGPRDAWIATLLGGSVLALCSPFVIWSVSGLENPLYAVLAASLAALLATSLANDRLFETRTAIAASFLCIALAATRPDGAIFAAAYPIIALLLWHQKGFRSLLRSWAAAGMAFLVPAAALLELRYHLFGAWVPNTAIAKGQGFRPSLKRVLDVLPMGGWLLPSVGLALFLLYSVSTWRRREGSWSEWSGLLAVTVPFSLAWVAYAILAADWMGEYRFATALLTLGAALFGTTLVLYARMVSSWPPVLAVGLASIIGFALTMAPRTIAFAEAPTVPGCKVADQMGRMLNLYSDRLGLADPTILIPDIGGALLTAKYTILDLAGLTDPTIGQARGKRDLSALGDYVFDTVHPELISYHGHWSKGIQDDPRFRRDYVAIVVKERDHGLDGGVFVRRDAISDPTALKKLQQDAAVWMADVAGYWRSHMGGTCGALERGSPPYAPL